ncbi:MAG: lamin tail domain-containing protein, partial [Terriglobia bacterium]
MLDTGTSAVNLQNARLTSAVDFTFPNVSINPGQRVLIVKNAAAFATRYNTAGLSILGQYSGTLSDSSDDVVLLDASNQIIDQVNYSDSEPWPVRADGAGSTLELISTSGSSNDPANWRASYEYGGTPGVAGAGPVNRVVVNEVLSHADALQLDSIELYNTTTASIDVSGWYLSDSSGNYKSFRIPSGTAIGAGQYLVFTGQDFDASPPVGGNIPFALSSEGDEVTLVSADASGNLLDFEDQVTFGAAAGESFGRWPNGTGQLYPMKSVTFGAANSGPRIGPIAISEVMYNPVGGDSNLEFVELVNLTTQTIDLSSNIPGVGDVPWKIEGIGFDFPVGTTIGPRGTLVVVHFDPNNPDDGFEVDAFRAAYGIGPDVQLVGPYNGLLDNA